MADNFKKPVTPEDILTKHFKDFKMVDSRSTNIRYDQSPENDAPYHNGQQTYHPQQYPVSSSAFPPTAMHQHAAPGQRMMAPANFQSPYATPSQGGDYSSGHDPHQYGPSPNVIAVQGSQDPHVTQTQAGNYSSGHEYRQHGPNPSAMAIFPGSQNPYAMQNRVSDLDYSNTSRQYAPGPNTAVPPRSFQNQNATQNQVFSCNSGHGPHRHGPSPNAMPFQSSQNPYATYHQLGVYSSSNGFRHYGPNANAMASPENNSSRHHGLNPSAMPQSSQTPYSTQDQLDSYSIMDGSPQYGLNPTAMARSENSQNPYPMHNRVGGYSFGNDPHPQGPSPNAMAPIENHRFRDVTNQHGLILNSMATSENSRNQNSTHSQVGGHSSRNGSHHYGPSPNAMAVPEISQTSYATHNPARGNAFMNSSHQYTSNPSAIGNPGSSQSPYTAQSQADNHNSGYGSRHYTPRHYSSRAAPFYNSVPGQNLPPQPPSLTGIELSSTSGAPSSLFSGSFIYDQARKRPRSPDSASEISEAASHSKVARTGMAEHEAPTRASTPGSVHTVNDPGLYKQLNALPAGLSNAQGHGLSGPGREGDDQPWSHLPGAHGVVRELPQVPQFPSAQAPPQPPAYGHQTSKGSAAAVAAASRRGLSSLPTVVSPSSPCAPAGQPKPGSRGKGRRYDVVAAADPGEVRKLLESLRQDDAKVSDLTQPAQLAEGIVLYDHQKVGLKWLEDAEGSERKGSILGDDMGLGKTIQATALILAHRSTDDNCKATLVVAPLNLVYQWEQELTAKVRVRDRLSVLVYHGKFRRAKTWEDLRRYDVVITSYTTLALEYARKKKQVDIRTDLNGQEVDTALKGANVHLFSGTGNWYRVILDEAHEIKNLNTLTAQAVCALGSEYRLAMTGTPMMNSIRDLYPLICFLRIKPYSDKPTFMNDLFRPLKSDYGHDRVTALNKLLVLFSVILLRRDKTSKVNGKLIVTLPERAAEVIYIDFPTDEAAFYHGLEEKVKAQFQRLSRKPRNNGVDKLILIIRLRQACCHKLLLPDSFHDLENLDLEDHDDSDDGLEDADIEDDQNEGGLEKEVASQPESKESDYPPTPKFIPSNLSQAGNTADGKGAKTVEDADDSEETPKRRSMQELEKKFQMSAKLAKLIELLHNIWDESKGHDKTIVFSQYTTLLDLAQISLEKHKIKFERIDGKMMPAARVEAIKNFGKDEKVLVMLVSLTTGNAGLNLMMANRVILMDPFWNPYVEDQAVDRVFRIGQQKKVHVYKLVVKDTIEASILEIQKRKREQIESALDENARKNSRSLNSNDLNMLFSLGE